MNRRDLFATVFAAAVMTGCTGQTDLPEDTTLDGPALDDPAIGDLGAASFALAAVDCSGNEDEDVICDGPGPGRTVFTLTAIDGTRLRGVNAFGQTFAADFTPSTKFKVANLSRFIPSDPIIPVEPVVELHPLSRTV